MNGLEQLTPDNQDLYVRVQKLFNLGWRHERVCDEIGLVGPNRVMDLCEWFIEYRTPKKLPLINAGYVHNVPVKASKTAAQTEQFLAWRRAQKGASEALEAMRA